MNKSKVSHVKSDLDLSDTSFLVLIAAEIPVLHHWLAYNCAVKYLLLTNNHNRVGGIVQISSIGLVLSSILKLSG
jgi:hypothetical protein